MAAANITLPQIAVKLCRICYETDNENDLISPCLCSGSSAYVHRKCLDNWRSLNTNGKSFSFCNVCQFKYVIEPVIDDPTADRKRLLLYRFLVTRDITVIMLLVQLIIVGIAFLLQLIDKKEKHIKDLYPDSMKSFGVYYLSSFILCLALLGLFGLIGSCCGWLRNESSSDNTTCPNCACYGCYFVPVNCPDCDSGGGHGGPFLLVVVLIFAIIGVFVGVILTGIILRKIIKRHTNKLWLRQEAKKYIVKDFQGRRDELTSAQIHKPIAQSPSGTKIGKTQAVKSTTVKPSAPLQAVKSTTVKPSAPLQAVKSITIKPSAPVQVSSITTYDAL
ncbi:unnamed protein product [Didymodactylos carnosus]|nr:unnamed protein product [Didymodactylos carnosus]CAF4374112.1 unnamed protein product [Didymodactylos carnosus]